MPRPRQYETRAEQQAAYRKRRTCSEQELLAHKGLPPLPAIPTMPGNARWSATIAQAHLLLSQAAQEMQTYHVVLTTRLGPLCRSILAHFDNRDWLNYQIWIRF